MCALFGDYIVILIHTSVKLVTWTLHADMSECRILIHTSVKLVTTNDPETGLNHLILIHTSVKLVTSPLVAARAWLTF